MCIAEGSNMRCQKITNRIR